jgi:hypothetical protein
MKHAKTMEEVLQERNLRPVKSKTAKLQRRRKTDGRASATKPDNLEKILRERNLRPAESQTPEMQRDCSTGATVTETRPENATTESVWTRRFRNLVQALARDAGSQWQLGGSCEVCDKYITQGEAERSSKMVGRTLCVRHLINAIP